MLEAQTEIPDWCLHTGEEPMPETSLHAYFSNLIVSAIRWMFRDRHDVFVTSNFAWYPEPNDSKDPDVLVVIGRTDVPRSSWRDAREDGMAPQVVFEIKSKGNTPAHVTAKRRWYDRHGVKEYYDYDPERGTFAAWGRAADTGHLEQIGRGAGYASPRLGLTFVLNGAALELVGPDGRVLGDYVAAERAAESERERADAERERAESEFGRAESESARAESERERAESEFGRAQAERERADLESARAEAALAELAALRAQIAARGSIGDG